MHKIHCMGVAIITYVYYVLWFWLDTTSPPKLLFPLQTRIHRINTAPNTLTVHSPHLTTCYTFFFHLVSICCRYSWRINMTAKLNKEFFRPDCWHSIMVEVRMGTMSGKGNTTIKPTHKIYIHVTMLYASVALQKHRKGWQCRDYDVLIISGRRYQITLCNHIETTQCMTYPMSRAEQTPHVYASTW